MAAANMDTQISGLATGAALATTDGKIDSILEDTGTTLPALLTTLDGKIDTIDTVADGIKVVTDNLPDSGALSDLSAILTDTGTTIPAQISGLNNLSAAQVNAEVDTALADYDGPTKTELDAVEAKIDTLDTVADAVRVVTDKINDTLEDDLGTYRFTTNALEQAPSGGGGGGDATEAKQDTIISALGVVDANVDLILEDTGTTLPAQISGIDTGSGSGAYTITATVTDGTNPLQGATVRVREGINAYTGTTDANGEVTFALDAATYSVAVTKDGYSFTPTTRTVTGEETGTLTDDLELTAITVVAADDPDECRVSGSNIRDLGGAVASDVSVLFELYVTPDGPAKSGGLLVQRTITATITAGVLTDTAGNSYVDLVRAESMTLESGSSAVWKVTCDEMGLVRDTIDTSASSLNFNSILS
jgi:hypothetical protein